jgi:ubiquinone/menaquinone biosynthesis C-methylase UbiE
MEGDILQRELEFQCNVAKKARVLLKRVPDYVVQRYKQCKEWKYYSKEAVFHAIHQFISDKSDLVACEFGCGDGMATCQVALVFPELHVIGLDVSPELVDIGHLYAEVNGVADRVEFVLGDAEKDVLLPESVNIMLALNIMHHVDISLALPSILRAVKPGGMVIFLEPIAFSQTLQKLRDFLPVKKDISPDERQLSYEEIETLKSSLENVRVQYFNFLGRMSRFFPASNLIDNGHPVTKLLITCIHCVDQFLFRFFPIFRKYSGKLMIIGHKPFCGYGC